MAKKLSAYSKKDAKRLQQKRQFDASLGDTSSFGRLSRLGEFEASEPEYLPRKFANSEDESVEGLPIIVDGTVKRVKRRKVELKSEDESSDDSDNRQSENELPSQEEVFVEISGNELKELVALYADLINSSPEEHLNKLKELVDMAEKTRKTSNRRLLLIALLSIFKSIIPGYNIKELTEAQRKEKVSNKVRQLRDYEQSLLSAYKRFVRLLRHSLKQSKEAQGSSTNGAPESMNSKTRGKYLLGSTALTVACDLIESVPHFNYRQELINIIVEKLASQRIDQPYHQCLQCLGSVFQQDEEGHVSFEAVQSLCRMVKVRRYKVDSRVIGVLINLRLLTELQGRADLDRLIKTKPTSIESQLKLKRKDRVHLTKTQRKARKEQKEIDEEMRKAELGVSAQVRERLQAQTLKLVFVLYMNILKVRSRNLLSATLEGLAKFAHLINAELYGDLLEVLREIMSTADEVNTRQSLLCTLTAFQLLKGQGSGEEQNTDLGFFVNSLYQTLYEMGTNPLIERSHKSLQSSHAGKFASETDLLVRCLELLFFKRRGVSRPRMLAFTKRLAECSIQFPERSCLVALKAMRELVKQHPEAAALLSTEDRVGRGNYDPSAEVPEQANSEVATIWEVALLRTHYDPRIQQAAKDVKR